MIMVLDQDVGRMWADHHEAFGRWIGDAARRVGEAFETLHRHQYDRPWARGERKQAGR